MAFQTRGRDPLLDSTMAEAIEKRGKELLGLALLGLGVMAAMLIGSYHPDDPSWMSATDAPVQNMLGRIGASIAAPLFMIVGWGAWGIAIVLGLWGLRFTFHQGEERAIGRLIFAPIWIAVLALYASSLMPGEAWSATHSFGLGGLFGDTVLGTVLGILPVGASFGLKFLSLMLGAGMLVLGAFVLGFTRFEVTTILRFLLVGVIMTYAMIMAGLGQAATYGARGAQSLRAKTADWRERRAADRAEAEELRRAEAAVPEPRVRRAPVMTAPEVPMAHAENVVAMPTQPVAAEKTGGLLSRMPSLMRRADRQVAEDMPEFDPIFDPSTAPTERVKAKITDVIKSRVRMGQPTYPEELGQGSEPLILNHGVTQDFPAEPPLTAAQAAIPAAPELPEYGIDEDDGFDTQYFETGSAASHPQAMPAVEPKKVVQHPPRRAPQQSSQARAEAQPALKLEDKPKVQYELPPLSLLSNPGQVQRHHLSDEALEENARMLENVLDDYGVKGEIVSVRPGPVVTMYELEPAPGLKASRVIGLADDIARSMSALSARVSTVPGRSVIGIELPNDYREMVVLREILSTRDFGDGNQKLPLALGKDIGGDPIVSNLAKMPHLLIAGTTGSGKSVAINTMILSLLYKLTPEECRLIMIDPKMLELSVYDGIPHLLSPVVTDPKKAVVALKWVVAEMEDRYRKMSKMGVRNIDGYNGRVADALAKNEMFSRTVQTGFDDETGEPVFETEEFAPEKMPYIVVIVDEMADLMMVAGKEIEACIQRLAQMARASGIHLIMATQRPSVDVITGTIKANFPTRISFQVTSKVDSRTILGEMGAEQLLGMGDMLYMAGGGKITRCHGPFVSDEEVEEIVNHLKAFGPPEYVGGVQDGPEEEKASNIDAVLGLTGGNTDGEDALYDQAVQIAITDRKCSTSYIQRKLAIGYNKAARLVEQMEDEGIVSSANHVGKREILVPEPQ